MPPRSADSRRRRATRLLALGALLAFAAAAPAAGEMKSTKLRPHLCETVGGGHFVRIPWFPGERIDGRLLPDIRWMRRRYDIFITDGLSSDPVHAANGEHPIGLATDIVPDTSRGGTWSKIGDLAHWAEPRQDHPRMPFRWVGWNGDPGHGRGNHLHLSWSHSDTDPGDPARIVYTRICPTDPGGGGGSGGRHHHHHRAHRRASGGTSVGGGSGSGGTRPGKMSRGALAPVVPETGE